MTVSYSLDVSKARFCGFTKLLIRWRGSIYKILWKEFLLFCAAYALISLTYRFLLSSDQREIFEKLVVFVEAFTDFIPLSFVLGFYVTLVVGRWWNQYCAIPWPDRTCFKIASYVHGSDDRSRKIRRTLGRYVLLLMVLTFQTVSTAVKRRFPTTQHLVTAGIMTKEEQSVYEKINFSYGKYWVPCHWFTALATRAKKEGRIKDSILLEGLFQEILDFRNNCAIMIGYDWVSVPLVYTQVVTIATYLYCIALLVGRQYLDPLKSYNKFHVDLYVPLFTLLQFFFYVGWLKVAEQILNPYGEDDDDYELNWCIDRAANVMNLVVDHLQMKHPKVKQDAYWDEQEIHLPQTKQSIGYVTDPQLGSASKLEFEEPKYLPLEELLEEDSSDNLYKESFRRKSAQRTNSSFIQRVLNSRFSQRRQSRTANRTLSNNQGRANPAFSMADEVGDESSCRSSVTSSRKSSIRNLVKKISSSSNKNSVKIRSSRQKSYNLQETHETQIPNGRSTGDSGTGGTAPPFSRSVSAPAATGSNDASDDNKIDEQDEDLEENPEEPAMDGLMPPIPEEASRANSLASVEVLAAAQRGERASIQIDRVHDLVKEASEVLQELSKSVAAQDTWKENEGKGYESCCSIDDSRDSSEDSLDEDAYQKGACEKGQKDAFVVVEIPKDDKKFDVL